MSEREIPLEVSLYSNSLKKDCECWRDNLFLVIADDRFPKEAILHLYCPFCSQGIRIDRSCMVELKGWLIHYNPTLLNSDMFVCLAQDPYQEHCILLYLEKKCGQA